MADRDNRAIPTLERELSHAPGLLANARRQNDAILSILESLDRLAEYEEMVNAADSIQFDNVRFVRGAGYCWISSKGEETVSLLDAYKSLKAIKEQAA